MKNCLTSLKALLVGAFIVIGLCTAPVNAAYTPPASNRVDINFNYDWKFIRSNVTGASATAFNDTAWQTVSLPHTWNDDKFREWIFISNDTKADPLRPSGTYYGIGWYRKHFTLPTTYNGRQIIVEFQGIGRVGTFYVNGQAAGINESGVGPAGVDITPYVTFGADNVIAVQVNNDENYHTLGYAGAILPFGQPFNPNFGGINRDVTLHVSDKLHQTLPLYRNLGTVGTYIYPSGLDTLNKTATINVQAEVKNDYTTSKAATFSAVVVDKAGTAVLTLSAASQTVAAGQKATFTTSGSLSGIHFWDPSYPYLYDVYTTLTVGGAVVDTQKVTTGFRKFTFAPTFGLEINGHPLYLNGYAPRCSMEWPAVGTPVDWMNEYDFLLMKASNANFVRPMHIAPRKVQVEAADKIGIVMVCPAANNEGDDTDPNIWQERLDEMRDVTIYYRNNPSVLFYEGCNQILTAQHMSDMLNVKKTWDPNGGRLAGLRSNDGDVTNAVREYSCTMDGAENQLANPLWDAEYARGEAPRRVWDNYTPMLNPRWDGVNTSTTPFHGTNTTSKYLIGGYFDIASEYHRALGLNSGNSDFIGDYLFPIPQSSGNPTHAYFRLQNSEDMVLENLAKYFARLGRSVFVQDAATNASKGVMVGGAKIIFSDSVTDGRMHDTEVTRVSGAVDGARLPKEVYYGMQVAQNPNPQVYVVGHWNYPAATTKTVYVVGNTPQVGLTTKDASGNVTNWGFGSKTFFPASILPTGGDQVNNYVFAFTGVTWKSGSITATGYDSKGNTVATNTKSTVGAPAKLKLTPTVGPSGQWQADGNDIAWYDVEVLDAAGNRCPTYEDTVTFSCSGAGQFLGGYNSGIRYSTNLNNVTSGYKLNIEAGINRVFVRSTRTAGSFTLNVTGTGLTSASSAITSVAITNTNGLATTFPQKYTVALGTEPTPVAEGVPPPPANPPVPPAPATNIVDLGYSGGNVGANVIENVQAGQKVYVDKNYTLPTLPAYLAGSEMIQPFQADAGATSATDQYQFNITDFSYIYLVIDAANAMPNNDNNAGYEWTKLTDTITINGRSMNIYRSRLMAPYENGYFADNGYGNSPFNASSNMYLVFVKSLEEQIVKPTDSIVASSTQGTGTTYIAANAIDGNVNTRWNAINGTFPQTLTLDLGQQYAIGGYTINWQSNATRYFQYKIEVSNDKANWTLSLDQQANKQLGLFQYRVPSLMAYDSDGNYISSRYVRITVTNASSGAWAAISEFQINGITLPAVPTISSPTTAAGSIVEPFTYQITANGLPTSFSATGLPAGLSVNTTSGIISGTPSAVGTSHITLKASNSLGTSPPVTLTLNVTATSVLPDITSASSATVTVNTTLSYHITATNSPTSYAATGLPAGLTLNTTTGVISGKPTATGTTHVTLTATNASGTGPATTLTIIVIPVSNLSAITSPITATAIQGALFTYQAKANNTPTSFTATGLPAGLTMSTSGLISGTPTVSGTKTIGLSATNANGTGPVTNLTLSIAASSDVNLALNGTATATSTNGTVNIASHAIDGSTTTRWESTAIDAVTYTIDLGSVNTIHTIALDWETAAGSDYTLQVSSNNSTWTTVSQPVTGNTVTGALLYPNIDAVGRYVRMVATARATNYGYSLWEFQVLGVAGANPVPAITSGTSAAGAVGSAFSYQASATFSPTSYSLTGTLPAGLTFNSTTGLLSGTPTTAGTSTLTLKATNAAGTSPAATLTITISGGGDLNVALNQPATSSSSQAGNLAASGNDGSATTRWAAADGTFPQSWQVDLGANKTLSHIDINWYGNATRSYEYVIETSTDNTNFATYVDNSDNTAVGPTSDAKVATARYVRITVSGASAGFASAYEFAVFGH